MCESLNPHGARVGKHAHTISLRQETCAQKYDIYRPDDDDCKYKNKYLLFLNKVFKTSFF